MATLIVIIVHICALERRGAGNQGKCLTRLVEGVTEVGLIRGFGTRYLVGRIGVIQPARIKTGLCLGDADAIALLLLCILGAEIVLEAVERRLRQKDLQRYINARSPSKTLTYHRHAENDVLLLQAQCMLVLFDLSARIAITDTYSGKL